MRLIIEAMPGRCIVAGRLTEDDPGMNLCTLSGELRYRDGSQRSARLRLLYREGQQLPAIGEYVLARVLPGEIMLEFLPEQRPGHALDFGFLFLIFYAPYLFRAGGDLKERARQNEADYCEQRHADDREDQERHNVCRH